VDQHLRLLCATVGNVVKQPGVGVKLGYLYETLKNYAKLIETYDASLKGADRFTNLVSNFHPNVSIWKERFYKNVPAFRLRSKRFVGFARTLEDRIDAVLQIGVLFNAKWDGFASPNFIYVDYTANLSARKPASGRSPFSPRQRSLWLELELEAFQQASHIFTRSDFVRGSVIRDYGIAPELVSTVGGGVNLESLPDIRKKNRNSPPTVLFIGKDFYRKGGDILLKAFAYARNQVSEARLNLVTNGPVPDDLPRENVTVIEPTWDRSVIDSLYREADVFALTSRLETWGDTLIEAMSYGLPCVGVQSDAMREIIQDGKTGTLVPSEDVESLGAALIPLLQNQELRDMCGRAGRVIVEKQFTWEQVAQKMVNVMRSVLA
jgi:glycosyltransferase involved in cell wall biosynthesis